MVAKNIVSSKQGLLPTPSMPKGLSKAQLTDNARQVLERRPSLFAIRLFTCLRNSGSITSVRMNLPNKLTVSRFVLTAAFLVAVFSAFPYSDTVGLALFSLAGITDFLDGKLARKYKLITNFGILMDPLADKIMVCSAFIAFVESSHLNPAAPVTNAFIMQTDLLCRAIVAHKCGLGSIFLRR